jgi:hypothetical protein
MKAGLNAKLNGVAACLINLSVTGAQVLVPLRLRPQEEVRLALADDHATLRMAGVIAWAALEMSGSAATQYRFGIEFRDAKQDPLEEYCVRNCLEPARTRAD